VQQELIIINHYQEVSSVQPTSTFSQLSVPVSSEGLSRSVLESDEMMEPYAKSSMD